jgi:hypothetical protein
MIPLPRPRTSWITPVALLAAGAVLADSAPPPKEAAAKPQEASIPFANQGGIRDWQADSDRGIWVKDNHNRWYYGRFMGPCNGLQFVEAVRFRTSPSGSLDRWSSLRARDTGNCSFTSFVHSDGPPRKPDKKAKAAGAEPAKPAPAPASD